MRVTLSHSHGEEEIRRIADQTVDQVLALHGPGFRLTPTAKRWEGRKLTFSLIVAVGPFQSPIAGFILCAPTEVTIDIDLPPLLARLLPEKTLQESVEQKVRRLLRLPGHQN